jgi:DNA-binding CsgD family transcriptional regulator
MPTPQVRGFGTASDPAFEGVTAARGAATVEAMAAAAPLCTRSIAALEAIERVVCEDRSTQQVVDEIVHRIARATDADAFIAGPTDPDTGLYVGAGLSSNIADTLSAPLWEHEFLIPDYNKFADLIAADPVGDLRQATGGKLSRSARYRTLNVTADLADELRAVLYAGGRPWGKLQLNRHSGAEPFTEADRSFLRAAAPLAGEVLRRTVLAPPARTDPTRGPGVLVVDETGIVISATAEADAWLQELTASRSTSIAIDPRLLLTPLRTLTGSGSLPRRIRLRTLSGTWLVAHASSLAGSSHVALVIEPATASEIASIVVEAYRLTGREVQVAHLVARGLSTNEIATALCVSRHTVRDHLKAIFHKVGVSSRGELTSRLFTDRDQTAVNAEIGDTARAGAVDQTGHIGAFDRTLAGAHRGGLAAAQHAHRTSLD